MSPEKESPSGKDFDAKMKALGEITDGFQAALKEFAQDDDPSVEQMWIELLVHQTHLAQMLTGIMQEMIWLNYTVSVMLNTIGETIADAYNIPTDKGRHN